MTDLSAAIALIRETEPDQVPFEPMEFRDGYAWPLNFAQAVATVLNAAADGRLVEAPTWRPFPGPDLDRVMVAGWSPPKGNVRGYWWYQEGHTDLEGMPLDSDATLWCPLPAPPEVQPRLTPCGHCQ